MLMMLSLLVGVSSPPPLVAPIATKPVILTPRSYNEPLPRLPEGAAPAVRAVSKGSLPQLFTTGDYPAAALRNGEEGTAAFAIAIDPAGRVTACSITQSSGSASLDATTCSILQRRARYTPARDSGGAAVEDRSHGRVRWTLPSQQPIPFADHRMALIYTIDAAGTVARCRVEASTAQPGNEALCASMMAKARSIAAAAAKSVAITNRELVLEQGVLVGGRERVSDIGLGSGESRGTLSVLTLEIDPAGAITHCAGDDGTAEQWRAKAACRDSIRRRFVPLDPTASGQPTRHAVRYSASYMRPAD